MKLIRYKEAGATRTGVAIDDNYYDTSAFGEDYGEQFFGSDGLARLQQYVTANRDQLRQLAGDIVLDCPVARPSKIICIGLNYADHARETNSPVPKEPIIFFKATTAIVGPNDDCNHSKEFCKDRLGGRTGGSDRKENILYTRVGCT
jgi:2-keto-4-pentenoate hydratase/2-oxohepta-3-ene-1,7-dioic acid hydratase in catechol pathway